MPVVVGRTTESSQRKKNVPIVHQEEIRQVAQPLDCLLVVDGDWFFAEVAIGHDQGTELALV